MNRMNCLYDLIFFFNFLVQAEVVVSVDLSLLVRERFVGKFLDPLAAARVVQVSRPLHLGLWSAKKLDVTFLHMLYSYHVNIHKMISNEIQTNARNNESMCSGYFFAMRSTGAAIMACTWFGEVSSCSFLPRRNRLHQPCTSHFRVPSTG